MFEAITKATAPDSEGLLIKWHGLLGCFHIAIALSFGIYLATVDVDWSVPVQVRANSWVQINTSASQVESFLAGAQTCLDESITGALTKFDSTNADISLETGCTSTSKFVVSGADDCSASQNNRCYVTPKTVEIMDSLSLHGLVFSFTLISGVVHLMSFLFFDTYLALVTQGTNYFRLFDYSVTAPLMWITLSVLWYAPPSLEQLLLGFFLLFQVILLGFAAEVLSFQNAPVAAAICYTGASLAYLMAWVNVVVTFAYGVSSKGSIDTTYLTKAAAAALQSVELNMSEYNTSMGDRWVEQFLKERGDTSNPLNSPNGTCRSDLLQQAHTINLDVSYELDRINHTANATFFDILDVQEDSSTPPTFVYLIITILFVTFSLFTVPAFRRLRRGFTELAQDTESLLSDEVAYNYLSFVSKATLTIVIWAGVIGRAEDVVVRSSNDESDGPDNSETDNGLWISFGAVFLFNIVLGGIMFWDYRRLRQTQSPSSTREPGAYTSLKRRRVHKFIFA